MPLTSKEREQLESMLNAAGMPPEFLSARLGALNLDTLTALQSAFKMGVMTALQAVGELTIKPNAPALGQVPGKAPVKKKRLGKKKR